jgi:hypothetical protein
MVKESTARAIRRAIVALQTIFDARKPKHHDRPEP